MREDLRCCSKSLEKSTYPSGYLDCSVLSLSFPSLFLCFHLPWKLNCFAEKVLINFPLSTKQGEFKITFFRGFLKFFNSYRKQYCCISYNVGVQSLCLKTRQLNPLQRFLWVGWFFFCSPHQEMQWIKG